MKIKKNFISNSSSASFIVDIAQLDGLQVAAIIMYKEMAKEINKTTTDKYDYINGWSVTLTPLKIHLETTMDNFDMCHFLQEIGVPESAITKIGSNY